MRRLVGDVAGVWRTTDRRTALAWSAALAATMPQVVRSRSLVPADRRMEGRTCSFSPLPGGRIVLGGAMFAAARELYCRGVYFLQPGFGIGPEDVVVDLGANAGLFTTMAAVYGARVVAVEAQSEFLPLIEANLARNGCSHKAILEHALLAEGSGLLATSASRQAATHWAREPARLSLADLVARHGLQRIDLLKVDIEGSEFALFTGDLAWIRGVQRIAMEVHTGFGDVQHLLDTLTDAGFAVVLVDAGTERETDALTDEAGYLFASRSSGRTAPRAGPL